MPSGLPPPPSSPSWSIPLPLSSSVPSRTLVPGSNTQVYANDMGNDRDSYSSPGPSYPPYPYVADSAATTSSWNPTSYPPDNPSWYPPEPGPSSYPAIQAFQAPAPPTSQYPSMTPSVQSYTPAQSLTPDTGEKQPVKKRRKKIVEDSAASPNGESEKRTKTGRACDACRTKKIRCDIIAPSQASAMDVPICAHCKQYGLECTFFLPITETRFKKKKQQQAAEAPTPRANGSVSLNSPVVLSEAAPKWQGRVEGPTSIAFLLHSSVNSTYAESYDLKFHNSWEVTAEGNGLIRINAPAAELEDTSRQKPALSASLISSLVNTYFDHIAPLFPIVSRAEFTSKSNPSPLLLYCICGLAATRRQYPREVFASVRGVINGLIRSNDILSDARFENVQALLLLSQVGDLHAQPTAATASAAMMRTATAIRMAQDLGLHRESSIRAQTAQDLAYVELRRRAWACCVVLDRWYGAALGIPLLVDLLDCDVLLPAPYDIIPEEDPSTWPVEPSFLALSEHLKLSILIGRVLKTIYSPTGLKHTTDAQLEALSADMTAWMDNLPPQLQFTGVDSSHAAGLFYMSYAALQFLFWRVFMRITYTCPPHLKFSLDVAQWSKLVRWSREAIEWLDKNDDALDTLFVFPYAATSCALVQYHTWARRRDPAALESLRIVKDVVKRWEIAVQPDQMSIRRKTCETMTLLYEAALKTTAIEERGDKLNPTPGVRLKPTTDKLTFHQDASRPGGGVFIAQSEEDREASGLTKKDIVLPSEIGVVKSEFETRRSETESSEVLQSMQMAAVNVNPQMNNYNGEGEMGMMFPNQDPMLMGSDQNAFDLSLLDGLPVANFDWDQWGNYFGAMDRSIESYQQM